jgi:hydroxypyruvate isomerase
MLYPHLPFVERMMHAARLGYRAIEFWDWRDKDVDALSREAKKLGLTVAAMSGNRRHSLLEPVSLPALMAEMEEVFEVALRLRCRNIMMLTDVLNSDGSAATTLTSADRRLSVCECLGALAKKAEGRGLTLLLEPLNTVLDHRGCFLDSSSAGVKIVESVNHPHVKLLYDIYHMTMMGEDVIAEIDSKLPWIGYFHAADVPGRHQPGSGTVPWQSIRNLLETRGYSGFFGMEFSPAGSDDAAIRKSIESLSLPRSQVPTS